MKHEYWEPNGLVFIEHNDAYVKVTRYFSLNKNARAYAIAASGRIAGGLKRAIADCKKSIAECKKYLEPEHGMTYHADYVG